jgi:homoprotocatechuate degradation regulator HpaR
MARAKAGGGPAADGEIAPGENGVGDTVKATVPMREFSRSLPMALLRAREAVMRQFRPSLRDAGLTEQQWRILRALAGIEQIEISELARETFLLGPSLSRILRDLEARRLIRRRAPQSDLRRGLVSLTPAGLSVLNAVAPISETIYAEIAAHFGADNLEALHKMLHALETRLLEIPVEPGRSIAPSDD